MGNFFLRCHWGLGVWMEGDGADFGLIRRDFSFVGAGAKYRVLTAADCAPTLITMRLLLPVAFPQRYHHPNVKIRLNRRSSRDLQIICSTWQ